jgi:hypothetical protein
LTPRVRAIGQRNQTGNTGLHSNTHKGQQTVPKEGTPAIGHATSKKWPEKQLPRRQNVNRQVPHGLTKHLLSKEGNPTIITKSICIIFQDKLSI